VKKQRKDTIKTRQRLIEAASEIFAEKGFKDATVAEICEKANTNVASINYHFRDKETLYVESWRYSFHESLKKYPPDGGVSEDVSPEERLKGRIISLLSRILDQDHREFSFLFKELAQPTGLLKELIKEEVKPLQEKMRALVRKLVGPKASDMQVRLCNSSIIGQCFHILTMKQRAVKMGEAANFFGFDLSVDNIDTFAKHIVKFSLAGIKAIREESLSKEQSRKVTDG
jgi:AcrR family transcriptional regulator